MLLIITLHFFFLFIKKNLTQLQVLLRQIRLKKAEFLNFNLCLRRHSIGCEYEIFHTLMDDNHYSHSRLTESLSLAQSRTLLIFHNTLLNFADKRDCDGSSGPGISVNRPRKILIKKKIMQKINEIFGNP